MTIATGQQATAADVLAAIAAARTVAVGQYTGNDAVSRQITVGFTCELVIINRPASQQWIATRQPNITTLVHKTASPYHVEDASNCYIDATDGFVVAVGGENSNANTIIYRYWAISD